MAKQTTQKVAPNDPLGKSTTPKAANTGEEVLPQKSVKAAEPPKKEPAKVEAK